jgi:mannose-6-phosphate isomerase
MHIPESLASINFDDFEPNVCGVEEKSVADCPFFAVQKATLSKASDVRQPGQFSLVAVTEGTVTCAGQSFGKGRFLIVPACGEGLDLTPVNGPAEVLLTTLPI